VKAGPLVDQVLERIRDPQGSITSRDFVRARISDAQRMLNAKYAWTLDSATLVTEPKRIFYPLTNLLPEASRVRFIQQGDRNLVMAPWSTWFGMRRGWQRVVGPAFVQWSPVGRDMIVLWPSMLTSESLTVLAARLTDALDADDDEMEAPDDALAAVVDLATALALLKARDLAPISEALAELVTRTKALAHVG